VAEVPVLVYTRSDAPPPPAAPSPPILALPSIGARTKRKS